MLGLLTRRKLLGERQEALLAEERALMKQLRTVLEAFGGDVVPADVRTLDENIQHLDELFLLVVAGEFNSGKSSFINALIGEQVLPEGVTPTTDRINILKYGDEPATQPRDEFVLEIFYPATVLREINVVDTPGTNAIIRQHEELTRDFIPRSDLVLFVTSADRPFTESERAFLGHIREWGKKVVLVINKVDILQPAEVEQVVNFVRENAAPLLGREPAVFPLSARLAQRAKANKETPEADWEASRFDPIESYITDTLDEEERIRLKLLNPLGVANSLTTKYRGLAERRLQLLHDDLKTIENIDSQIELYRSDLQRDFQFHLTDIENILHEMELRGMQFFDDTVRIGRMFDLIKGDRIREEFEEQVIGDTPAEIDKRVQAIIDWVVERQLRLWQSVNDYLNRRRISEHRDELFGDVGHSFEYNRAALLESVGRTAQQVVASYDKTAEAEELARDVQGAMRTTAAIEIGAVTLGGVLLAALSTVAADVTGILAASVIAAMGFYIIPSKRKQAKAEFHAKVSELRDQLARTVNRQVNSELDKSISRIREATGPYTRFVRAQREQLTTTEASLREIEASLGRIRAEVMR